MPPALLRAKTSLRQVSLNSNIGARTMASSAGTTFTTTSTSAFSQLNVVPAAQPLSPPAFYRPQGSKNPVHWQTDQPRGFKSPWDSAKKDGGLLHFLKNRVSQRNEFDMPPLPKKGEGLPIVRPATWSETGNESADRHDGQLRVTWIGHAGCHFQIPVPDPTSSSGTRMVNLLTDPVLSKRCSPFQFMGPARYTEPCTSIQDMAKSDRAWPDIMVISHNHYDHLDYNTIKALVSKPNGRAQPLFFVPLGLKAWFTAQTPELPSEKVVELDWWEERVVEFSSGSQDSDSSDTGRLRFVCTPAQHFSARSPFDRNQTLWASWAMHVLGPRSTTESSASATPSTPLPRLWFSGDSGYRWVPGNLPPSEEESLPHCPAFKEIGDLLGPFDVAMIACGAYKPRSVFSLIHVSHRIFSFSADDDK